MIQKNKHKIIAEMKAHDKEFPLRFNEFIQQEFTEHLPSRKSVQKAIKRGECLLNEQIGKTGDWVNEGDNIKLIKGIQKEKKIFKINIKVVYEDDFLAVIDKPAGINVGGNQFRNIDNALPGILTKSNQKDALDYPKYVHRLDNPTSGLLLIAKTRSAQIDLGKQFQEKKISKKYQAIVLGKIDSAGLINETIDGLDAETVYERIKIVQSEDFGEISLVNLYPKTGRTHQLRKHLSYIGYPILGDSQYGGCINNKCINRLYLAAVGLAFFHSISKELKEIEIKAPDSFSKVLGI